MHIHLPGLILLLTVGLAVFLIALVAYTRHLLTHPPRRTYAWAVSRNLPGDPSELPPVHFPTPSSPPISLSYTEWTFRTRNIDLPIWDIPGLNPRGPIFIMIHGWGDSRITMLSRLPAFAPVASRIVMIDLPGHGNSPRSNTCTLGIREVDDLLALLDLLRSDTPAREAPPATPILLYGFSMGAAIALAAAARDPRNGGIAGVIAEAPYRLPITPARNVLRARGLPYRLNLPLALRLLRPRPTFDTLDAAHALHALPGSHSLRVLVLHGEHDDIAPPQDGREIADAAGGEFILIPDTHHTNMWTQPHSITLSTAAIALFCAGSLPHPFHPKPA